VSIALLDTNKLNTLSPKARDGLYTQQAQRRATHDRWIETWIETRIETSKRLVKFGMGLLLWVMIVTGIQAAIAPIADAAPLTCRPYHEREVCIDRIKRSAKHYWEYRVNLTIDGQKQPEDVLDCRHYQRIDRDGFIEPFRSDDVGRFVCRYFKHRS
jgi:hypothetical protein